MAPKTLIFRWAKSELIFFVTLSGMKCVSVQGTAKVVSFCIVLKKSAAEQCLAEVVSFWLPASWMQDLWWCFVLTHYFANVVFRLVFAWKHIPGSCCLNVLLWKEAHQHLMETDEGDIHRTHQKTFVFSGKNTDFQRMFPYTTPFWSAVFQVGEAPFRVRAPRLKI